MERLNDGRAGLVLNNEWDVSINDLLAKQAEGYNVLRTPHVGNMSVHNMTLLDAGISAWLVDSLPLNRDTDYQAGAVLRAGESTTINSSGQLACRAMVELEGFGGVRVPDYHEHALNTALALPRERLDTASRYLRRHESIVSEIVDITACEFPEVYKQTVDKDGFLRSDVRAAERVKNLGIMQLEGGLSGAAVILPVEVSLLATFVIEAMKTERDVQYHVSGSKFYLYQKQIARGLDEMYQKLQSKASFRYRLPQHLKVIIPPAASAVLATTNQRRSQLQTAAAAAAEYSAQIQELKESGADYAAAFKRGPVKVRKAIIEAKHELQVRIAAAGQAAQAAVAECDDAIFGVDRSRDRFVTQYDVLAEGGLYVAEANRSLTMRQLAALDKKL